MKKARCLTAHSNVSDSRRRFTTEDGETETARTRFSLVRTPEGGVDVLFYPKLDECDLNLFNEQQKQRLLEGKAIIGYLESNEVNKEAGGKRFFQIDPESKQVLCVPMPVIGRNMQYVSDRYHLTGAEMQKLQNGDVLSILNEDDEEISVGIDLNSKTGIRFAAGDEQTWRREAKREWDKYNFGAFGCWVADDNGDLNYVHEEDYSEEVAGTEEDGYACDATLIHRMQVKPQNQRTMAATKYYPEDELVEKFQSGEYGWIDYVNHHSPEWQEEYTAFCRERGLTINEESAEQFVEWKGDQLENEQED